MSRPLVSVVVPTFHAAPYLVRMIESVRAQTFEDWELILVDGKSNDATREIVESYRLELADRLVLIEQDNRGCCVARNTGIDAARGDLVAFLDADDEFLPAKLARQLELFDRRPDLGLVYCDYAYVDDRGCEGASVFDDLLPLARDVPYEEIAPGLRVCSRDLFDYLIRGYFIATIVGLVRREVLDGGVRFITDNPYGFSEWVFYLDVVRAYRAGYVNEPLCRHHFTNGSITRTSTIRNAVAHRKLLSTMFDRYAGASGTARRELDRQMADASDQLGMQSYRHGEYAAAVRFFVESLSKRCAGRTLIHLLQSCSRCLATGGGEGREPALRKRATDRAVGSCEAS